MAESNPQNPNPTPEKPSSSSSEPRETREPRKPRIGDLVIFRDWDGDRPAFVAHVFPNLNVRLTVLLSNGSWGIRDDVMREGRLDDGSIQGDGRWRFPERGGFVTVIPDKPKVKE